MKTAARIGIAVLGAVALTVAVVAYRTVTYRAPAVASATPVPELAAAVAIDSARAAEHLAQAVRIRTVSHQDPGENDWAQWDRFHGWLQSTYPAAHAAMTREVVAGHTLVYTWPGADASLPAVLLLAHQDVVPVTPGTEGDWKHAPLTASSPTMPCGVAAAWTTRDRWSPCSRRSMRLRPADSSHGAR